MDVLQVVGGADPIAGSWNGLVIFFGGTPWDGNRFPDQHMAERLTRWAPVLYVDPPLSAVRAGGVRAMRPRLERLDDRLVRLTPLAPPGPLRRGVREVTNAVVRRTTRHAVARLGGRPDVVVVASLSPLLDAVPARLRVLYGTDDFAAGAELMGADGRWLQARERHQLRHADVVIAVSDELAGRWRSLGTAVEVIENGVDLELFRHVDSVPAAADVTLRPPIAGFIGHLSDRIDVTLLEAVAERGHSLLIVGPRQATFDPERIAGLLARPNVQWTGARPFTALPSYLRVMDVGLLPYADTAFNRASFPLKTLEYLAAGRPCVVTDLPAMHRLGDVVEITHSPQAFSDAVTRALSTGVDASAAEGRRSVAALHDWDARASDMAVLLGLSGGGRAVA